MTNREIQTRWARVWLGEIPEKLSYGAGAVLEKSIPAAKSALIKPKSVGVRILFMGHAFNFGMLGVLFTPNTSGQLSTQIALSKNQPSYDMKWAGIFERSNAEAAIDEAVLFAQKMDFLGSGILHFTHAAENPVHSARIVYQWIVRAIIALLDPALENATDEDVEIVIGQSKWPDKTRDEIKAMIAKRATQNQELITDG